MIETPILTSINLVGDCTAVECLKMAHEMRTKLDIPKYTRGVSLLPVPETMEEWRADHRTARKRAARAQRLGYWFSEIDRSKYAEDILAVNLSLSTRQGRPMSSGYRDPSVSALPDYPCPRHKILTYGVLEGQALVAYLTLYRLNELALVSMILGHGDHLRRDVMYLLVAGVVADQQGQGGFFYYNRHDSGQDGLRYFKERLGFQAGDIAWSM